MYTVIIDYLDIEGKIKSAEIENVSNIDPEDTISQVNFILDAKLNICKDLGRVLDIDFIEEDEIPDDLYYDEEE